MSVKLFFEAIIKILLGFLIVGLLLFLPAGTMSYWNAWLLMGLLFVPMFVAGFVMMFKAPDLLRRRLYAKEKQNDQKKVIFLSALMFIAGFIIAGLDYKYVWTPLPHFVVIIATIIFVFSYILYAEVLRENKYISRIIHVEENQKVVDTGLYKFVRHPMYTSTIFLFLSMPLMLGSLLSFIIFLAYPFIIAKRIRNEEKVLEKELLGYIEYKQKVKYKLIPFIW